MEVEAGMEGGRGTVELKFVDSAGGGAKKEGIAAGGFTGGTTVGAGADGSVGAKLKSGFGTSVCTEGAVAGTIGVGVGAAGAEEGCVGCTGAAAASRKENVGFGASLGAVVAGIIGENEGAVVVGGAKKE